jgi:hypothetical protein
MFSESPTVKSFVLTKEAMMTNNSPISAVQQKNEDFRSRTQFRQDDRNSEQIPVQPLALIELAGTAENWIKADNRKLKKSCNDYEEEICKRLQMLDLHELALVRETFRLSLCNKN